MILIIIGIVAPIGRVISLIPAPVVGGTAVVVYAIVMGLGIQLLQKVDFHQQSNRVIAAVALAVGLLPILIPGFYDKFPADVRILLDSGVAVGPSPQPSSTSSSITWGPGAATPRTATSPRSSTTSTTTPWRHRSKTRPGGAGSRSRRATAHRTPVGWPHARSRTRTDDRHDHTDLDRDELLLEPGWVLLQDGPARHQAVLVRHRVYLEVGRSETVESLHPRTSPRLRLEETLLMPGLVDTHHHLTQSFGKALVFGERPRPSGECGCPSRAAWTRRPPIWPPSSPRWNRCGAASQPSATRAPAWNRTSAWWPEAAGSTGIRCVLGMICNDLRPDGSTEPHDVVMARAQAHLDRWQQHDLIHASLAVSIPEAATHSPSPPCQSSAAAAGRSSRLTSTSTSRRWNALWEDAILGPQCLLAHVTLLTPTEITMLRDSDTAVSYNPVASSFEGNAVAAALTFAAQGIRFGVGTDGTRGDGFRLTDSSGMSTYALIGLAVLVAAFVQGSTGLGFALISGPVIGMIQPRLLPVFLLIQMIPLNGYVTWRERHALDVAGTTWISLGRFVGTFGGLGVLLLVSERQLGLLIGISTVLAVLMTLLAPSFEPGKGAFLTAGLVTGVTETSTGVGGPPLALVYQHRPAPVLRSTIAACFLIGELISLVILAMSDKITPDQVRVAFLLLPAVIVGALMSRLVHHRLEGKLMRYLVLGFALVSGIVVTVQAL